MKKSGSKTVLFISADEMLADIYTELFEEKKISVKHTAKGEKALAFLKEKKPNCVILDMAIPKEDGFEFVKNKSQFNTLKHIPLIMLSHLCDPQMIKKARRAGISHYCLKLHTHPSRVVKRAIELIEECENLNH